MAEFTTMTHRNYHEVEGDTPLECGRALGRLFGARLRGYIADERKSRTWRQRKREAEALLSITSTVFPAYIEELGAYAEAARVSLLDLWTLTIEDELSEDDCEKCTTIVSKNGRFILHNEDWDADATEDICILKKRCGNITTLELYYYGCPLGGCAITISSRGYIQAINSLNHSDEQLGVPKLMIARRLSEVSDLDAELPGILAIPRSSGFAHNLIDRAGRVTSIECTATKHVVRQATLPFVHTNHILDRGLATLAGPADGKSTFRRYAAACDRVGASLDETALLRLASDESSGRIDSIFNRNTIARAIVDLDRRVVGMWLRRESQRQWEHYPIDFFFDAAAPVA